MKRCYLYVEFVEAIRPAAIVCRQSGPAGSLLLLCLALGIASCNGRGKQDTAPAAERTFAPAATEDPWYTKQRETDCPLGEQNLLAIQAVEKAVAADTRQRVFGEPDP